MNPRKTDYKYAVSWLLFMTITTFICAFIYDYRLSQIPEEPVSSYWATRCQNETLPICHDIMESTNPEENYR